VLYCLVEKEPGDGAAGAATTRAATRATTRQSGGELLGPVWLDVRWGAPKLRIADEIRMLRQRHARYPIVYAGRVLLNRRGTATLSVFPRNGDLLAERTIEVKALRPALWVTFARPRTGSEQSAAAYVALDAAAPAAPNYSGYAGVPIVTTRPAAADAPLPADLVEDANGDPRLRLALEADEFIVRLERGRHSPFLAPDQMLARWWVNGEPRVQKDWPAARQYMQQQRRSGEEFATAFALPDFLGVLKPGDRVRLQLLWCPEGHEPIPSERAIEQLRQRMMRQAVPGWEWPVMTNRIEFELTAELLAKRDAPPPPPDKVDPP
jgi:hypothetical protein